MIPIELLLHSPRCEQPHPVGVVAQALRTRSDENRSLVLQASPNAQVLYDYCLDHGITKLAPQDVNRRCFVERGSLLHKWLIHEVMLFGYTNQTPHPSHPILTDDLNRWLLTGVWRYPSLPVWAGCVHGLDVSLRHLSPSYVENPVIHGLFWLMGNVSVMLPWLRWFITAEKHLPPVPLFDPSDFPTEETPTQVIIP